MATDEKDTPAPLRFEVDAKAAETRRRERLAEVQRRLQAGELDSELALVETALALLDGDLPDVR